MMDSPAVRPSSSEKSSTSASDSENLSMLGLWMDRRGGVDDLDDDADPAPKLVRLSRSSKRGEARPFKVASLPGEGGLRMASSEVLRLRSIVCWSEAGRAVLLLRVRWLTLVELPEDRSRGCRIRLLDLFSACAFHHM